MWFMVTVYLKFFFFFCFYCGEKEWVIRIGWKKFVTIYLFCQICKSKWLNWPTRGKIKIGQKVYLLMFILKENIRTLNKKLNWNGLITIKNSLNYSIKYFLILKNSWKILNIKMNSKNNILVKFIFLVILINFIQIQLIFHVCGNN